MHEVAWRFCGREVEPNERALIQDVVARFPGLSRGELALTICEWLAWRRPNGRLKAREAREFLERLARARVLVLPDTRAGRPRGSSTRIPITPGGDAQPAVTGMVGDLGPIIVERVDGPDAQRLFRELVGRYHYLGYRVPVGAVPFCSTSLTH